MRFSETLKQLWTGLTSYLLARDVPTLTRSVADGVRKVLTLPSGIVQRLVATSPPRLLICLTVIAASLLGAWIISMFFGR